MGCDQDYEDHFEKLRQQILNRLFRNGANADIRGMEISSLIRSLANYYGAAIHNRTIPGELSGPRMGLLLHLLAEEECGNAQGINPTSLSHFQHVKKNTISSLLRGLEEKGLVERTLDPQDKRVFKIRITQAGKDLIQTMGPKRLGLMNDLASALTDAEKDQLIILLDKLRKSIKENAGIPLKSEKEDDFPE